MRILLQDKFFFADKKLGPRIVFFCNFLFLAVIKHVQHILSWLLFSCSVSASRTKPVRAGRPASLNFTDSWM